MKIQKFFILILLSLIPNLCAEEGELLRRIKTLEQEVLLLNQRLDLLQEGWMKQQNKKVTIAPPPNTPTPLASTSVNQSSPTLVIDQRPTQISALANKSYETAMAALRKKSYDKAETLFNNIITSYPSSDKIIPAYYWLGEVYLSKNKPDEALKAFVQGYKLDPYADKAPDILYKIAILAKNQGNATYACDYLALIKRNYQSITASLSKMVNKEQQILACP